MLAKMTLVKVDPEGRVRIPEPLLETFGRRYHIAGLHDGIKLIPISDDPIEGLQEALEPIQGASLGTLQDARRAQARSEIEREQDTDP